MLFYQGIESNLELMNIINKTIMKYVKTFILLLVFMTSINSNAQVEFYIDTLEVSNYKRNIKDNYGTYDEAYYHLMQGPYIVFNCVFKNNTSDTISLNLYSEDYHATYKYNDTNYKYEMRKSDFRMLLKPTPLIPYDTVKITLSNYIFQYNSLNPYPNVLKHDFLPDLQKVLPTLRLMFKGKDLELTSTHINKIVYGKEEIDE